MRKKRFGACAFLSALLVLLLSVNCMAATGLSWGRFLIQPRLTVQEEYTDNAFLDEKEEKDDNVVTISPELTNYFAIADNSKLRFRYKGDYSYHANYDNLDKSKNQGNVDWNVNFPAGSTLSIGGRLLEDSVQPDFEKDIDDPYLLTTAFADTMIKAGAFTELGLRYEFRERDFEDRIYDDFQRNEIRFDYVNRYFSRFPFLLEYRFSNNDRQDPAASKLDSQSNEIYVGARWTPETRLSGDLRVGYQNTDYKGIADADTLVVDTKLIYRLTDMTRLQLRVDRRLRDSTLAEDETGNNYTFTNWEGVITYNYSAPLRFTLRSGIQNKDYENEANRKDDIYHTRLMARYNLNRWVSFALSYQYRRADSTIETQEYVENSGYLNVRLKI